MHLQEKRSKANSLGRMGKGSLLGKMRLLEGKEKKMKIRTISDIHDCEKCHGKMVCIEIDLVGVTRCAYCHEVVNYSSLRDNPEFQKFIKEIKNDN